jgi:ABC-type transport system involved in multi-copper enzyme maturation permease subunit
MTRSMVLQLALKDFYLSRWIVISSLLGGAFALAVTPLDSVGFYVGSVSFLCVLIVLNIFLVMSGVIQEKKDKVRLFVLSLPISTQQYVVSKAAANFAAFFIPWLLLTAASLVVIDVSAIPNGFMPIVLGASTYILTYYCVLLGVAIGSESQLGPNLVILAGNISINFLIPVLFRMPSGRGHLTATASWGSDIVGLLGAELAVGAAALTLGIFLQSRKKDFV